MFSKKILLDFKRLPLQSFAMHDEGTSYIYYTWHYELTIKKSTWFGLKEKIVTEHARWNASKPELIEKQLSDKIGKLIK